MGGPGCHEDLPKSPPAPSPELKVGSKLWQFDHNRRVYRKDANGISTGGPIWREHWKPVEVVGETRVSWLISSSGANLRYANKVPKKEFRDGKCPSGYALSEESINREAWVHDNAWHIGQAVTRCQDYDLLKKVADLFGYKDKEPST